MSVTADQFRAFLAEVELPAAPPPPDALAEPTAFQPTTSEQAVVVGSEIVGFTGSVDLELRRGLVASFLLAQLVTEARVSDKTNVIARHATMREVLTSLGWLIVNESEESFAKKGDDLDAHTAILAIATSALGGVALAIVHTVIDQIRIASDNQPWFKVFSSKSMESTAANYQLSTVETVGAHSRASIMDFLIKADTDLRQIAFFRRQTSAASLDVRRTDFSIDADTLRSRAEEIGAKVSAFQSSYVASLELPPLPGR